MQHQQQEEDGPVSEAIGRTVLTALDCVPESYRLPIWLRFCLGFGPSETAETLAIPEPNLGGLLEQGMRELTRTLGQMNVQTDVFALEAALASVPSERAPASLLAGVCALAAAESPPATRMTLRTSGRRVRAGRRGSFGQRTFRTIRPATPASRPEGLVLGDFEAVNYN